MKIAIIGDMKGIALEFLEKLVSEIKFKNIQNIQRYDGNLKLELKDGTVYETRKNTKELRGCKFDKIYVDENINEYALYNIILRTVELSKLPKNEQVIYF